MPPRRGLWSHFTGGWCSPHPQRHLRLCLCPQGQPVPRDTWGRDHWSPRPGSSVWALGRERSWSPQPDSKLCRVFPNYALRVLPGGGLVTAQSPSVSESVYTYTQPGILLTQCGPNPCPHRLRFQQTDGGGGGGQQHSSRVTSPEKSLQPSSQARTPDGGSQLHGLGSHSRRCSRLGVIVRLQTSSVLLLIRRLGLHFQLALLRPHPYPQKPLHSHRRAGGETLTLWDIFTVSHVSPRGTESQSPTAATRSRAHPC